MKKALKDFEVPEIVKLRKFDEGLNIVELFHGKTMAFKDLGLSVVGSLIECFLKKENKNVIILVGNTDFLIF